MVSDGVGDDFATVSGVREVLNSHGCVTDCIRRSEVIPLEVVLYGKE